MAAHCPKHCHLIFRMPHHASRVRDATLHNIPSKRSHRDTCCTRKSNRVCQQTLRKQQAHIAKLQQNQHKESNPAPVHASTVAPTFQSRVTRRDPTVSDATSNCKLSKQSYSSSESDTRRSNLTFVSNLPRLQRFLLGRSRNLAHSEASRRRRRAASATHCTLRALKQR